MSQTPFEEESTVAIHSFNEGNGDIPEIKVNDVKEEKVKKKSRSLELYEEIDEIGSFVEDQKTYPEVIIKTTKVNFINLASQNIKNNLSFSLVRFQVKQRHRLAFCDVTLDTPTWWYSQTETWVLNQSDVDMLLTYK